MLFASLSSFSLWLISDTVRSHLEPPVPCGAPVALRSLRRPAERLLPGAMLGGWQDHLLRISPLNHWTRPLRVGTDCSGAGAPELALADLAVGGGPPVSVFASEIGKASRRWLFQNVTPGIMFQDLVMREFRGHTPSDAEISGATLPSGRTVAIGALDANLDLYVAGFPCTPFSDRGAKHAFEDEASLTFWSAVKTISTLRPRAVVLENVHGLVKRECLKKVLDALKIVKGYLVRAVLLNSKDFGIPQNRCRIYIMMLREDSLLHREDTIDPMKNVLQLLARAQTTAPTFGKYLHMHGQPLIPLLEQPAKPSEPTKPSAPSCTCSLSGGCQVHPCFCRLCKGSALPGLRRCVWRQYLRTHLAKPRVRKQKAQYLKLWRKVRKDPKMKAAPSYFQLAASKRYLLADVLTTQRERCTVGALSSIRNLFDSNTVFDIGQNIDRAAIRSDGNVPTLTCGCSKIFVPCAGIYLSSAQCLALQGFDARRCKVDGFSEEELFHFAGNAMTMHVVAAVMWAVLTQVTP
jgi:DNA-cytosine methyltransferase